MEERDEMKMFGLRVVKERLHEVFIIKKTSSTHEEVKLDGSFSSIARAFESHGKCE
jgi:hypothetical protein